MVRDKVSAVRYSLFITEWCNENCSYCEIPQQKHKLDSWRYLIGEFLPIIDQGAFNCYTITGGEPALSNNLDLVLDIITKPVKVNSNGTLITSGLFEKYYDKIDEIGLHMMKTPLDPLPDNDAIYDEKVVLYIPIDNTNYMSACDLAIKNPKITFNFIPHIRKKKNDKGSKCLSLDNMKELWKGLCNTTNTQSSSLNLIRKLTDETISKYRLFCQNSNCRYMFDFVSARIYRCAKSRVRNDNVEMNIENIKKAHDMSLFPKKETMDESCGDCFYFAYFFPYALKNAIIRGRNES